VPGGASAFEIDEGDEEDLSDLEALIAAVDTWQGIDAVADLGQITRFWAVEKYIGHVDGYAGDPVPNNYYLHSDDAGRFTMIPWGTDYTWDSRLAYGDPGARMFERCLADAACRTLYHRAVLDVRDAVGALDLEGLASDTAALIDPWRRIDPRRESSLETIQSRERDLHAFLAVRPYDDVWRTARPPQPAIELATPEAVEEGSGALLASPPAPGLPVGPGAVARRLAIGAVRVTGRRVATSAELPHAGRLTKRVTARIAGKRRTVCRARVTAARAGALSVRCALSRAARRRLRAGALAATVHLRLVPADGPALEIRRRVRLVSR